MGVIIVDSEYESCAVVLESLIREVLELGQGFSKELLNLSENGFRDILIDNAIIDKSFRIYTAMLKMEEVTKDMSSSINGFIQEADKTDSYLY